MEAQKIVPEAAAVSTAANLPALLDAGQRALAQARPTILIGCELRTQRKPSRPRPRY